jgi:hypothetical protein
MIPINTENAAPVKDASSPIEASGEDEPTDGSPTNPAAIDASQDFSPSRFLKTSLGARPGL